MNRSYSTTELAKMWGVSESSIKRWADAGTIKCQKTIGGHRKFDLDDVLEFQTRSGLITGDLALTKAAARSDSEMEGLLATLDFAELSHHYLTTALEGRYIKASTIVREAYLRGAKLAAIAEEIIRPAMKETGERWRRREVSVFEEHLVTSVTLQALAGLNSIIAKKQSAEKLALVGCSEGEFHHIASLMVQCLLESEGWAVIYLGPHTPLFSYADAIKKMEPSLVCISMTVTGNIEHASRDYQSLRRTASKHETKIVIGGQAVEDDSVRARFGGALYTATLYDLMEMLKRNDA
ncbi:MAG: helix-turn-helix domain-containing protein [Blastocatellia bacterium]|nr:helix-turn-helix domain-containing protein [Blastocatellia bacterium]